MASPPTKTSTSAELTKPNALIALRPTSGRLTVVARKVYNSILYQTQQALDEGTEDGYFEAPLRVLLTDASINPDSGQTLENVIRYLSEMQTTQVDWLSMAAADRLVSTPADPATEEVLFDSSGLLYRSKVVRRDGLLWVRWKLPEEIVSALAIRENVLWTRVQLKIVAQLSSYTAVALYEICSRYKTHVAGLTARQSIAWWTDALSQAPGGAERREWRKFKVDKLNAAIEEINQVTDLRIKLVEHKKGRAIAEAQFEIKRVPKPESDDKGGMVVDLALLERGRRVGLSDTQMTDLCRRFGDDRVRAKMREFEVRVASKDLPKIQSVLGYFKSILRSGDSPAQTVADTREGADDGAREEVNAAEVKVHNAVEASRLAAQQAASELRARVRAEFELLPESERLAFAERTLDAFQRGSTCTPVMRSRIKDRRFDHPMLSAIVINAWAEATYGPNWQQGLPEA